MNGQPQDFAEWRGSQKFLHWLMAALILTQIGLGLLMVNWKPDTRTSFYLVQTHKSIGFTILVLVLIRLAVRLRYGGLPFPAHMPGWERALTQSVHFLLYCAMVALPLTGWLMGSAAGFPTRPFLLFTLPDLVGKNEPLVTPLRLTHNTLAFLVAGMLVLHIAGALKHHLIDRDDILRRMLPRTLRAKEVTLPPGADSGPSSDRRGN